MAVVDMKSCLKAKVMKMVINNEVLRNDEKAVFFGLLGHKVVHLIGEADENIARFKVNLLRVGIADGFTLKNLNYFYVIMNMRTAMELGTIILISAAVKIC